MNLSEILKQPEGFTPPEVTVKIEKVYEYKSGETENGPWSFQNLQVTGGKLKLKGLPEFPKAREGQTVTLKANSSKQHGLTGLKVNHEEYKGRTYHQLLITNSAKWSFAEGSTNGSSAPQSSPKLSEQSIEGYVNHLLSCAALANRITTVLGVSSEDAIQACFATVCIDSNRLGITLPKDLPTFGPEAEAEKKVDDPFAGAPEPDEPPQGYEDNPDEDIPF